LRVLGVSRAEVMRDDVAFGSIPELGRLLRARKLSSTDLTELYLERLERFGPRYNCVVTVTPERALAEAATADRELRAGRVRRPPAPGRGRRRGGSTTGAGDRLPVLAPPSPRDWCRSPSARRLPGRSSPPPPTAASPACAPRTVS